MEVSQLSPGPHWGIDKLSLDKVIQPGLMGSIHADPKPQGPAHLLCRSLSSVWSNGLNALTVLKVRSPRVSSAQ